MFKLLCPITIGVAFLACLAVTGATARAQFTPGHVYVSVIQGEGCLSGEFVGILDIDPTTGAVSTFAHHHDGLCGISGLTFTPDGQNLLVASTGAYGAGDLGWVRSFASDGSSEVVLDGEDGLHWPSGSNCLAYDRDGNLYVVTGDNQYIMRYALDGTSEVVADADDGVVFQGSIAVAPNGDVFFCSFRTDEVIKITPDGVGTLFDVLDSPRSIAVDRRGNLFVGSSSTDIYRYEVAIASERELLASGYAFALRAIAMSPDDTQLLVVDRAALHAIDVVTGSAIMVAGPFTASAQGITVHIDFRADVDGDRDIDLRDAAVFENDPLDLNNDGEANERDFAVLTNALTGP